MTATHSPSSAQSELLPCPFCGGPVSLENPIGRSKWWGVVCRNTENRGGTCAIEQRPSASKEAAIERWNRRAAACAHTIGEDAANVAMGEREAFWSIHEFLGIASTRLYPTPDKPNSDWAKLRAAVDALALIQARAALTAEKVAGQEPVTSEQVKALEVAVCNGQSGEALRLLHHMRNALAAPQQPAQPVAQTLALTDFQINLLASHYWEVKEVMGARTDKFDAVGFARALLAAKPASSLAEGGEHE